jgi:phosphoglycolate phosphatase-like HAD superfamily hydrolase
LNHHGISVEYTTYVGDRVEDLIAANMNHMPCVGVGWGYGADGFDGHIDLVDTPSTLLAYC